MKVYFISGLAADRRVFKYIKLPEGFEPVYIDWIQPHKKESLVDYSLRLAAAVDTSESFVLVGLSMGGMIATEIASVFPPHKLILLSSTATSSQLPYYFHWARKTGIYRLVPISFLKSMALLKRLFTTETADDKETLRTIIRDSDPSFIRWAVSAILHWERRDHPPDYIHIHGSRDEMLPVRFVRPTHLIKKAGHLMVLNHAAEVNKILKETLEPR